MKLFQSEAHMDSFELYATVRVVGVRVTLPRKIFETQGYGVLWGMPKAKSLLSETENQTKYNQNLSNIQAKFPV